MDAVAMIGAVMGPLVLIATLYINKKFDGIVSDLKFRLMLCEARHAAIDKNQVPEKEPLPPPEIHG